MKVHRPLALLALLALGGCATQPGSCNSANADASLLTKASCDYSGGYAEQVRRQEQELVDARAENEQFRQVYEQIAAQQSATRESLQVQQRKQAELDRSLGQLLGQLKNRHANKGAVQQQIAGLEQQLKASRSAPASSDPAAVAARQAELKALQQKVSRLQLSLGYE